MNQPPARGSETASWISPELAGAATRPATADDVDLLTELMAASALVAIGEPDVTREEVAGELTRPGTDLDQGSFLVVHGGRAIGYGVIEEADGLQAHLDVYVAPHLSDDAFGELGRYLTGRCLERLDHLLAGQPARSVPIYAGAYRAEARLGAVLAAAGMEPVRAYWRMDALLGPPSGASGAEVAGLRIRPLAVADEPPERELAHRLFEESFAQHFAHQPMTFERFWNDFNRLPFYDPALWWVAELDDRPVGLAIGDTRRVADGSGWVRTLGVVPEARGRGVGRALLLEAFAEFQARGLRRVQLGVDAQNDTGATRLYESVGMVPAVVIDSYRCYAPR